MVVPLWQNVLFRNRDGNTYYSLEVVRQGVLTTAQIAEGDKGEECFTRSLPMLTKRVYRSASNRICDFGGACFAPYHLPEFRLNWPKKCMCMALHLSTSCSTKPKLPVSVWQCFNKVVATTHFAEILRPMG